MYTDKPFQTAESPDGENSVAVLDRKSVLERVGDNPAFVDELYSIFLNELPKRLDKIEAILRLDDFEAVLKQMHSLRSVTWTIGALSSFHLVEQVEQAAQAEDLAGVREFGKRLMGELVKVKTIMHGTMGDAKRSP